MPEERTLPAAIRQLRNRRNITQAELAAELGISATAVQFIETGRHVPGLTRTAKKILTAYPSLTPLFLGDAITQAFLQSLERTSQPA
jgi:DNA-binding XRE family transcriptional regulator